MKQLTKAGLCLAFILVVILIVSFTMTSNRNARNRYSSFWDNPGEYDVWLMGTSHMYYSVQPMELWENYGIRSFDIAAPSSFMTQTYWTLKCALRKATPKLIILDTYHVNQQHTVVGMEEKVHVGLDAIPLSITKIQAINDLLDSKKYNKLQYVFPVFFKYGKWYKMTQNDLDTKYSATKGSRIATGLNSYSDVELVDYNILGETDTTGAEYLRKIINLCKENDIPLVLTALPYFGNEPCQKGLNAARVTAEESNVPFLDIQHMNGIINPIFDYSTDGHPNFSGSQKLSSYIGKYIIENCNVENYKKSADEEICNRWDDDYIDYVNYYVRKMKKRTSLENYLLFLRDASLSVDIYIEDMDSLTETEQLLIKNISNANFISKDYAKKEAETIHNYGDVIIIVKHNGLNEIVHSATFKNGKKIKQE